MLILLKEYADADIADADAICWVTWSGGWVLLVGVFGAIIVTANPKSAICR